MIHLGDPIYLDDVGRIFSRRRKDRTFLGWSHTDEDLEEGTKLILGRYSSPDPQPEEGTVDILLK